MSFQGVDQTGVHKAQFLACWWSKSIASQMKKKSIACETRQRDYIDLTEGVCFDRLVDFVLDNHCPNQSVNHRNLHEWQKFKQDMMKKLARTRVCSSKAESGKWCVYNS